MSVELRIPLPRLSSLAFDVCVEPHLHNYEAKIFPFMPRTLFCGIHAYAQLIYAIEVKPNILETDPGPLDARVS